MLIRASLQLDGGVIDSLSTPGTPESVNPLLTKISKIALGAYRLQSSFLTCEVVNACDQSDVD